MKIRVHDLQGLQLAAAVVLALGGEVKRGDLCHMEKLIYSFPEERWDYLGNFRPDEDWSLAGELAEEYGIEVLCNVSAREAKTGKGWKPDWFACYKGTKHRHYHGERPTVAICKAFVANHFNAPYDVIEIPDGIEP